MWEYFPYQGGGSDPFPLVYVCFTKFFFACQNHPEVLKNIFYYYKKFLFWDIFRKKTVFRRKNSHTGGVGGGVFPRGNYSHIIPFFFLKTSLTHSRLRGEQAANLRFNSCVKMPLQPDLYHSHLQLQYANFIFHKWNVMRINDEQTLALQPHIYIITI